MITLAEAKEDFTSIREFPYKERGRDFDLLWHSGYWDGVLSGVLRMDGREHWFELVREGVVALSANLEEHISGRNFAIVSLTDEQIQELHRRHEDFRVSVGGHTDYRDGQRRLGANGTDREGYYKRAKEWPPLDFSGNEVVAWWGRLHTTEYDLLYDMITDDAADLIWTTVEERLDRAERRRQFDQWYTDYFNNDPLYLTLVEGIKDPVFNPEKQGGLGQTFEGWVPEFKLNERRGVRRIASHTPNQPYTIDLEWAVSTGPIKLQIFLNGQTHDTKVFWDHSPASIEAALAHAKAVILGGPPS